MPLFREWWQNPHQGPILPTPTIFEDRSTGTRYQLSHDSDADTLELVTPSERATSEPVEPLVWTPYGSLRIYVTGGELLAEDAQPEEDGRQDQPVFSLDYADPTVAYELHGRTAAQGFLCLAKYEGIGTTLVVTEIGCTLAFGENVFASGVFEDEVFV